jgi:DNA-directed RNA polymerase specialized sigma24 family protein
VPTRNSASPAGQSPSGNAPEETSRHEQRLTDAHLADAVARGDVRAAAALYDAHAARLYGLAMAMLGSADDADAVLVAAFAEASTGIAEFDASREPMIDWLVSIVYRRSLQCIRSRPTVESTERAPSAPDYELQLNREQPALSRAQSGRLVR